MIFTNYQTQTEQLLFRKLQELLKTIKKSWPSGMDIDIIECRKKEFTVDSERCNGCIKARRFNLESDSICEWLPCANKEDRSGFIKEDMLFESVVTNSIYYGLFFVLYLTGAWTPTLIGIALMFGGGNAFDSVVSWLAYRHFRIRLEKNN